MGIRPSLHFGLALAVEPDEEEWNPKGWPSDWRETPVFGPTKEQTDAAWQTYQEQEHDSDMFYHSLYLGSVRDLFCSERGKGKEVSDYVYYDAEHGKPDLAFFIHESSKYAASYLYALTYLHEEYESGGFFELPQIDPSEDYSEDANWWKLAQRGIKVKYPKIVEAYQRRIDDGHNYVGFSYYVDVRIDPAMWLFNEVLGLDVKRKDLKLGILWAWG